MLGLELFKRNRNEDRKRDKKKINSKKELQVLFNVNCELIGWQGPFKDTEKLKRIAKQVEFAEKNYRGKFKILENGELVKGSEKGLHTYFGEADLDAPKDLHVHFPGGGFYYIHTCHGKTFLEGMREAYQFRKDLEKDNIREHRLQPTYTLSGLYETLSNKRMSTKIKVLTDSLKRQVDYDFESIAAGKDTRLKLLECVYRRKVSNQ